MNNFSLLKLIYIHLQSKSDRYPWVTFYCARKHFLKKICYGYSLDKRFLDIALKEADQADHNNLVRVLTRSKFMALIVILSKYIFSDG